ncbi:hypothetical protein Tsubulata_001574, partial [Turnera subulata]
VLVLLLPTCNRSRNSRNDIALHAAPLLKAALSIRFENETLNLSSGAVVFAAWNGSKVCRHQRIYTGSKVIMYSRKEETANYYLLLEDNQIM